MNTQRHKIITDSAKMFFANVVTAVTGIVRGIVIAGVLGPNNYGIWSIFNVIMSYVPYTHFGLLDGMTKQIPLLKGKGSFEHVKVMRDTAWSALMVITLVITVVMLSGSFIFQNRFSNEVVVGFRILACLIFFFQIFIFLTSYIRLDDHFSLLSISMGGQTVISLVLMLILFNTLSNKLYAALLALIVTYLIINAGILLTTKYDLKLKFDLSAIRSMVFSGLPIVIICIGNVLILSIDRWVVAGSLGRQELGFYGFAFTISNFLSLLPTSISFTLYTKMLHRYGQTNDPRSSEKFVYLPSLVVSYFMSLACVATAVVMPVFIRFALPAYAKGIDTVVVLLMAGYFISTVSLFGNFLISVDKVRQVFIAQVVAILLNLAINITVVRLGYGIKGVAFGTGFSYLIYATLVIFFTQLNFHSKFKDIFLKIVELYLPFIIMLAVFLIFKSVYGENDNILIVGLQVLIISGFAILFMVFLNKKINFSELLKGVFAKNSD